MKWLEYIRYPFLTRTPIFQQRSICESDRRIPAISSSYPINPVNWMHEIYYILYI